MFNKQTFYSVNKADPDAIVYIDSEGRILRLTCEDFSSPEEFRNWKEWSDKQYHQVENADHRYANHTISLEILKSFAASVSGPEDQAGQKEEDKLEKRRDQELFNRIRSCLTDVQFRRLWMYAVDRKALEKIAAEECVSVPTVYESIQAALKNVKKLLINSKTP